MTASKDRQDHQYEKPSQGAHTPGPWVVRGERVMAHRKMMTGSHKYNEEDIMSLAREPVERLANARLIAAAPDMLAALKEAEQAIVHLGGEVACEETLQSIIKAIHRAEGSKP